MQDPGFTGCLTHMPEDCKVHQGMITAAQAAATHDIANQFTWASDHQVQYPNAGKEGLL